MSYLLSQIFWCLLVAFLLGFALGWLLRHLACRDQLAALRERPTSGRADASTPVASRPAVPEIAPQPLKAGPATGAAAAVQVEPDPSPAAAGEASALAAAADEHSERSYPVEEIQGIGRGFGTRLRQIGIETTEQLLAAALSAEGRQQICEACELDDGTVRNWAKMADLLRIRGIGGQWAELLWRCGLRNVQDLAGRDAIPLLETMHRVNEEEHRVFELPGEHRVVGWIEESASIERRLPDDWPR